MSQQLCTGEVNTAVFNGATGSSKRHILIIPDVAFTGLVIQVDSTDWGRRCETLYIRTVSARLTPTILVSQVRHLYIDNRHSKYS